MCNPLVHISESLLDAKIEYAVHYRGCASFMQAFFAKFSLLFGFCQKLRRICRIRTFNDRIERAAQERKRAKKGAARMDGSLGNDALRRQPVSIVDRAGAVCSDTTFFRIHAYVRAAALKPAWGAIRETKSSRKRSFSFPSSVHLYRPTFGVPFRLKSATGGGERERAAAKGNGAP